MFTSINEGNLDDFQNLKKAKSEIKKGKR